MLLCKLKSFLMTVIFPNCWLI